MVVGPFTCPLVLITPRIAHSNQVSSAKLFGIHSIKTGDGVGVTFVCKMGWNGVVSIHECGYLEQVRCDQPYVLVSSRLCVSK